MADTPLYGLMAEFASTDALVSAAERVHQEGYTRIDALTPMPVHGLAEAMGYDDRRIQKMILAGGLFGCLAGLGLQLHVNLIGWNINIGGVYLSGYPLNIGGRPLVSLPAFIVPTFETDHPVRGADRRHRHAGAVRLPAAVPPGVQREALPRARIDGRPVPLRRSRRSEVRRGADPRPAPGPRGERGV